MYEGIIGAVADQASSLDYKKQFIPIRTLMSRKAVARYNNISRLD